MCKKLVQSTVQTIDVLNAALTELSKHDEVSSNGMLREQVKEVGSKLSALKVRMQSDLLSDKTSKKDKSSASKSTDSTDREWELSQASKDKKEDKPTVPVKVKEVKEDKTVEASHFKPGDDVYYKIGKNRVYCTVKTVGKDGKLILKSEKGSEIVRASKNVKHGKRDIPAAPVQVIPEKDRKPAAPAIKPEVSLKAKFTDLDENQKKEFLRMIGKEVGLDMSLWLSLLQGAAIAEESSPEVILDLISIPASECKKVG